MKTAVLIYPHQLFKKHPALKKNQDVYLIEDELFFTQYTFHFNKLVLHRASMKFYESYLKSKGYIVYYIEKLVTTSDIKKKLKQEYEQIILCDPVDDWLIKRLNKTFGSKIVYLETPMFICDSKFIDMYADKKDKFLMENFYREQRKRLNILMTKDGLPQGGKWNFDKENRDRLPKYITVPDTYIPQENEFVKEAKKYVRKNFSFVGGEDNFIYPTTFYEAQKSFDIFLNDKLANFGDYEDAISKDENFVFHSVLTPYLNIGLITPKEVIDKTLEFAEENKVPMNSLEGFVRQIIGWREFMRLVYVKKGAEMRTTNFFKFKNKIPKYFYSFDSGIVPLDNVLKKVSTRGYCHHIERLMILSNIMLLLEIKPDDVYRWFMEFFVDSYDWVMVPNIYGMGQFADGGIFATKPYISSSNYILKMSNFEKGEWITKIDALFWVFLKNNQEKLKNNYRMGFMMKNLEKKDSELMKSFNKISKELKQ